MIVAIEAASTDLSIAIADPDGRILAEDAWTSARRQSAELLPRLQALLAAHDRGLSQLSGIGVGSGPGSFTGLRVAMALAKGLAVGLRRPMVAVPSLTAWLDADPAAEVAVARAGARDAYVLSRGEPDAMVVDREGLVERLDGTIVVAPSELAEAFAIEGAHAPRGASAVARATATRLAADANGDDPRTVERLDGTIVVAPSELAEAFAIEGAHAPRGASAVARATATQLAADANGDDPRTVEPIYLRAPRGVVTEGEGEVRWL